MQLYYAETMNPRKACATAKHLGLPVSYVKLDLGRGEHKSPDHLARNPNGKVPVLVDGGRTMWESLAIMAHLSNVAGSDLWPARDPERQVEVLRWTSWGSTHFMPHASTFYFERHVKPKLLQKVPDLAAIERATPGFHASARILDAHLEGRRFVATDHLTIADFVIGVLLPDADALGLPIADYRNVRRWHEGLMELPAWRDPWP